MPDRLHAMFVHAHPDDESSKGAATMARYAKEGKRISVVTLTDGGAGDVLNEAAHQPGLTERMVEVRREELMAALEILGVTDHHWFGYPDSGYVKDFDGDGSALPPETFWHADLDEVTARLVRIIREDRPEVLVTYPPDGGYPHPDHIRTHEVSVAAFSAAADPDRFPGLGGEPHQVQKLYYVGAFNRRKVMALHACCDERGLTSPFTGWLERWDPDEKDPSTTHVDVGDYLGLRSQALLAHATQVAPDSLWFAIPDEVVAEVYPWEDFTLAESLVPTELPEDSLFAGLE